MRYRYAYFCLAVSQAFIAWSGALTRAADRMNAHAVKWTTRAKAAAHRM